MDGWMDGSMGWEESGRGGGRERRTHATHQTAPSCLVDLDFSDEVGIELGEIVEYVPS